MSKVRKPRTPEQRERERLAAAEKYKADPEGARRRAREHYAKHAETLRIRSREAARLRRKLDPEGVRERDRIWRSENSGKVCAYRRAAYSANPEKIAKQNAAWRTANPEKVKAMRKAWSEQHPEKVRAAHRTWANSHPDILKNTPSYIASTLKIRGAYRERIPPELIEAKRLQLKLKRKLKELAK